jgi:hypothetical protein
VSRKECVKCRAGRAKQYEYLMNAQQGTYVGRGFIKVGPPTGMAAGGRPAVGIAT